MKDFRLRNDTVLLFRNEPMTDITNLTTRKKVLFVYGGSSVHQNGCRAAVEGSLKRLQSDHIDLYFQHRIDRR